MDLSIVGILLALALGLLVGAIWLALALSRARDELRVVASNSSAAMAHVVGRGQSLRYRFVNDRYAALYGRMPADVLGRRPKEVLGDEVFARAQPNMARALDGETVTFDLPLGGRLVEVVYAPDRKGGAVRGFVGVITDVTELRRLQSAVAERRL